MCPTRSLRLQVRRPRTGVSSAPQRLQRVRVTFSRGTDAKYCSHLDLMRLWERALRRAALPLAYSEGFTPHARIALASPLPVGVTSEGELMEVYLRKRVSPHFFLDQIRPQLPAGIDISMVEEANIAAPSLQALVRFAEYQVTVECPQTRQEVEARIASLLAQKEVLIERRRPGGAKSLDLRALVEQIWVERMEMGRCVLGMVLRTDSHV
ncbi:MAG: TIGR03936 family radical SAM-associated protein, partial [Dehalococcoidia bacterium]|nr:TIGR03936 family radical SAM-associated protein [Dehalococcoidia bacterium]